jgi:condensin-2 complex subunit H2
LEDDSATAGQSMTDNFQQEHHRNGFTCTNFTNAAILLQNSSSVYSRKVEYLYSLVYQTLQDLNSKCHVGKSGDNIFGGGNESNPSRFKRLDPDIEQFECFDPNWNFLMFDENTLPLDTKGDIIDLPPSSSDYAWEAGDVEDENDNAAFHGKQGKNLFTSSVYLDQHKQRCQLQDTTIMNSSTLTQSVGKLSIIQQRKQQQQWMRQYMEQQPVYIGGGEEVTFKLLNGMCHVSDTGALLLPGTINHDDESQRKTHESVSNDRNSSVQQLDFYNDLGDDDDNGITGWEIHPHSPTMANTDRCEQSLTRKDTSCGDVIDGQRNENVNIPLLEKNIQSITLDPWDLLDPHDVSQSKYRPMKAITTFCLPNGVDQLPSFAATGFKINDVKNTKKKNNCTDLKELQEEELDASFCETLESSGLAVKGYRAVLCRVRDNDEAMDTSAAECELMEPFSYKKTKSLSLHTLAYGSEFHYILKSQSKRKAANRKKQKQTHLKYRNETAEVIDASERFHDMYGDNDDDDDDDDDNHDGPAFDFVDDHESTDLQTPNENNVKDCHVDAFDGVFVNEKTFGDRTFEELCRAHLKEFAKGAEKFAVESQLSKRVSNWQSKIENVLCVEERRPEFNIHTYGTQIITNARLCIDQQRSVVKQSTMVCISCICCVCVLFFFSFFYFDFYVIQLSNNHMTYHTCFTLPGTWFSGVTLLGRD